jgi:acetoacetyl-CoA synthetase
MPTPLWSPSAERIARSNLNRYLFAVDRAHGPGLNRYDALYRWSVERPEDFWPCLWEFCGVKAQSRGETVLEDEGAMPGARWFPGARLNFAENLLRHRDDRAALVFRSEDGRRERLSYAELYREVARLAAGLRAAGVGAGDRVAGFLPNAPAAVIALLATASIGATWSACPPEIGLEGALERLGRVRPRVLFACEGYRWGGAYHDSLGDVAGLAAGLEDLRRVVLVPDGRAGTDPAKAPAAIPGAVAYADFVDPTAEEVHFEQLPFDHPLYILYSTGPDGRGRCLVHGAGGVLLQHLKELALHCDVRGGDVVSYATSCGWMMWNWLVSALALGATVLLYDGSPFHPRDAALFDLAEQEGVTVLGVSARYLAQAYKRGLRPRQTHDLSHLLTILSSGAPLHPEGYDYVYREVKADVLLASLLGGTDIASCYALSCPILAVNRGEIQTRGLGMRVEVLDADGEPVRGEPGELAVTAPFPAMPLGFLDDPEGGELRRVYLDTYHRAWRVGDLAEVTEHEGLIVHGRAEAALEHQGVRIGTASIYRQVERFEEVTEALAVPQETPAGRRIVLFVKLRAGTELDEVLAERIKRGIREGASARHVPDLIVGVDDIPRTAGGRPAEDAVRRVLDGERPQGLGALANPKALAAFLDLPALRVTGR